MKILTDKQVDNIIAKNNKIFKAASAAEKRVLIAKDVLSQIRAKKIVAEYGEWMNIPSGYENGEESAQRKLINNEIKECRCCALGGLFASCTKFNNQMSTYDFDGYQIGDKIACREKIPNGLNKYFTNSQLALIEFCYEEGQGRFSKFHLKRFRISKKTMLRANKFIDDNDRDSKTIMIKIMNNIVKNNGTFKP